MPGEKSAHKGREARSRSLKVVYSDDRNPEIVAAGKKMRRIVHAPEARGRMLLQWATFRACSGFRYIQMGNPRKEDVFDDVDGMCEAVRKVVGSAPFHPLRRRFKIHGGTIVARRWGRGEGICAKHLLEPPRWGWKPQPQ